MSKYKILKDFPVFTTGNKVFGNIEVGDDDFVPANDFVAKSLIEAGYIEPIEEHKRWRAEEGGVYYMVVDGGGVVGVHDRHTKCDDYRYSIGNYFKTGAEASAKREYDIALRTIQDDAKGFVPDSTNAGQYKWHGVYDYEFEVFDTDADYNNYYRLGDIYFATDDDVKHSQKIHKKEWKIVRDYGKEENNVRIEIQVNRQN